MILMSAVRSNCGAMGGGSVPSGGTLKNPGGNSASGVGVWSVAEVDEPDCLPSWPHFDAVATILVDVDYSDTHGMYEVAKEVPL